MKNTIKKLGAIALAGAITLSTFTTRAYAQVDTTGTPQGLTKILDLSQDDLAVVPNETFSFTVTPVGAGPVQVRENAGADQQTIILADAPANFLSLADNGQINFNSANSADVRGDQVGTINFVYNNAAITAPGVYRYQITEQALDRDGLAVDSNPTRYLDFYVTRQADGTLVVDTVNQVNEDGVKMSDTGDIPDSVNVGGQTGSAVGQTGNMNFVNTYTTYSLTVSKQVEGNLGDRARDFDFQINLAGQGEENYVVTQGANVTTAGQGEIQAQIAHDGSVLISGLSPQDTYTVTETDYSAEGYETTGQVETATAMGDADTTVTVTNTYDQMIPTGLISNIFPFILVIAAATIFAIVYFRRDKEEDNVQ